jgi:hypothetical protein
MMSDQDQGLSIAFVLRLRLCVRKMLGRFCRRLEFGKGVEGARLVEHRI